MAEKENVVQKKPQQRMRYDDVELEMIRSLFTENDDLLIVLRKVFLKAPLSKKDKENLKVISNNPKNIKLLRKTYFPEIDLDAPFGQLIDLWLSVDKGERGVEESVLALKVRESLMKEIFAGIERLKNPDVIVGNKIVDYKPNFENDDDSVYIDFVVRNALITHSEFQITQLKALSMTKNLSADDISKRMKQDKTN